MAGIADKSAVETTSKAKRFMHFSSYIFVWFSDLLYFVRKSEARKSRLRGSLSAGCAAVFLPAG